MWHRYIFSAMDMLNFDNNLILPVQRINITGLTAYMYINVDIFSKLSPFRIRYAPWTFMQKEPLDYYDTLFHLYHFYYVFYRNRIWRSSEPAAEHYKIRMPTIYRLNQNRTRDFCALNNEWTVSAYLFHLWHWPPLNRFNDTRASTS